MPLSVREAPYQIPSYSLTGDLLAFLTCGLQYRFHNKGSLPPSTPVQRWFGEFIHAVMEEAFLHWGEARPPFPWNWNPTIRRIELDVERRLRTRGLFAPPNLFDYRGDEQRLASQRTENAINHWGQHLFPLIAEAEVRLQGIRAMPAQVFGQPRADYYEVTGVADVITSVQIDAAKGGNRLLAHLLAEPGVEQLAEQMHAATYEVIIDYKGTRRPSVVVTDRRHPLKGQPNQDWSTHSQQVLTYAWLRSQQAGSAPVVAGIILYLNELMPSAEDMGALKEAISSSPAGTDVVPTSEDLTTLRGWAAGSPPALSAAFREARSIRVIPVTTDGIRRSLESFDRVVADIESTVSMETAGQGIVQSWPPRPERRNCTACDFRSYCPPSAQPGLPTVP